MNNSLARLLTLALVCAAMILASSCAAPTTAAKTPAADVRASYPKPEPAPPLSDSTFVLLDTASADVSTAFERLRHAEVFQTERVSIDGHVSDNVVAFRTLRKSPKALELFAALGRESTTIGMLYAAVGLYDLDPNEFAQVIEALESRRGERATLHVGCMTDVETVGELVRASQDGIVLEPGQSLIAWLKRHGTGNLDIVGGGYTATFAHAGEGFERRQP